MPLSVKSSGTWHTLKKLYAKNSGEWKNAKMAYVKHEGVWKKIWSNVNASYSGWSLPNSMTGGVGIIGPGLVVVDKYLYCFGGYTAIGNSAGSKTNLAFKISLIDGAVTQLSNLPNQVAEVTCTFLDGLIYINCYDGYYEFWYSYNIGTNTYSQVYYASNPIYRRGLGQDMSKRNGSYLNEYWFLNGKRESSDSVYRMFRSYQFNGQSTYRALPDETTNYLMLVAPTRSGDVYAFKTTELAAPGMYYYKWSAANNTWTKLGVCPWGNSTYTSVYQGKAIEGADGKIYIILRKDNHSFDIYTFDPGSNTFSVLFNVRDNDGSSYSYGTGFLNPTMQHDYDERCFWIINPEKIDDNSYKNNIYKLEY